MKRFLGTTTGRRLAAVIGGGFVALLVLAASGSLPDTIQDGLANAVDNVGVDLPGGENRLGTAGAGADDPVGPMFFPELELEPFSPSPPPSSTPTATPRPYRPRSGSTYYDPYAETDDDFSYYDPYAEEVDDDDTVYIPPEDSDGDDSGAGYGEPGEGGEPGVPNGGNDNAGTPGEGGPGGAPGL